MHVSICIPFKIVTISKYMNLVRGVIINTERERERWVIQFKFVKIFLYFKINLTINNNTFFTNIIIFHSKIFIYYHHNTHEIMVDTKK